MRVSVFGLGRTGPSVDLGELPGGNSARAQRGVDVAGDRIARFIPADAALGRRSNLSSVRSSENLEEQNPPALQCATSVTAAEVLPWHPGEPP